MRGLSLPVMSQPHKFVASFAPALEGRSTHTTTGLSKFGLIGSYVMIWWYGQFNHRERDWDWDESRERERQREGERERERYGERDRERGRARSREREWEIRIVAIRWLTTCAIHSITNYVRSTYMPQVFTHYSYHYTHYYTTIHYLSQPLPKYRPAIILHRSSDNIFNLCTVFHPRPR